MKTAAEIPLAVKRALRKLGGDITTARKRRRITMELMAERAFVTRQTIARLERGDPGCSLGTYATVMFILGLLDRVENNVDTGADPLGLALESEHLPTRVRPRKRL